MEKRVTITDLARLLGMDKSSISLALRDSPKMSQATRARVQHAAREYNYAPNWAAKQLASSSAHAIGVVMPGAFAELSHPTVMRTIRSLARLSAERGILLNIIGNEQLVTLLDQPVAMPLHADGLFVWGDVPAASAARLSASYDRPSIVLDPHHPSYARYKGSSICIRNKEGAAALVRHLVERGTQNLTFVQTVKEHLSHEDRFRGAKQAWAEQGAPDQLRRVHIDQLTDSELREFSGRPNPAFFCSNDWGAMQVWHRLHRLGISVPGDVKLAGFDGDEYGALIGLTTAIFDGEALAQKAFTGLHGMMTNRAEKMGPEWIPITVQVGATS